jgi:very-short-patch-repair endonuclease
MSDDLIARLTAKPRRFRFDFAFVAQKLAVEVQGAVWTRGRHTRGGGATSDAEKLSLAAVGGWRVIVATAEHVDSGQAVAWIEQALAQ